MKRALLLTALLCLYLTDSRSQTNANCGTETSYTELDTLDVPWYGDNEYLYRILDTHHEYVTNAAERAGLHCVDEILGTLSIPVRFWVWEAFPGESGITEENLRHQMIVLNNGFESNGLNIRFHMRCPQFPIDADLINIENNGEFNELNNNGALDAGALNVHVVNSGNGNNRAWWGKYGGILFNDFVAIVRESFDAVEDPAITLIHEIGHYFGLDHPHKHTEDFFDGEPACCKAEPVTRGKRWHTPCIGCAYVGIPWKNRRCSRTGDYLCDTPADPQGTSGTDCTFNETGWMDTYGDTFSPDVTNYMSYYRFSCLRKFSPTQKAIILDQIFFHPLREFIHEASDITIPVDTYEPDDTDFPGVPSLIAVNELQCHSMNNNAGLSCIGPDEDWLRIDNENGALGGYKIIVRDLDGYDNPVQDVFIHNTNNSGERTNAIAVTMTDNGAERIWKIPCSAMEPNTTSPDQYDFNDFLVQITKASGVQGLYEVKLERLLQKNPRLTDREQVCVGSSFDITNLPIGATVTWSAQNMTLSNTTGASTTITSVVPEGDLVIYKITAVVELEGCTYRLSDTFTEIATSTLPSIGSITMDVTGPGCQPQFTFSVPDVTGAIFYEWECSAPDIDGTFFGCFGDVSNGTTAYSHASAVSDSEQPFSVQVTVTASNDCGASVTKSQGFLYRPEECDTHIRSVHITPNPVNDAYFTLEIEDESVQPIEYQIVISNQYGIPVYMNTSTDKVHQIGTYSFANGLYYAEVLAETDLITTAFFLQY